MNRSTASEIIAGIFVIVFGLLALAKGLFGWPIGITFTSFWALVIIAILIISIVHKGLHFVNVLFLVIGGWLLINEFGLRGRHTFLTLIAVLIIVFGLWIILNAIKLSVGNYNSSADMNDYIHYGNSFSNNRVSNSSKNFKGGNISSTFGRTCVDLSSIAIQQNAVIDISATFGTVEIIMPRSVPYRTDITPVFGTFINNAPLNPVVPEMPYLLIKGSSVFGTCTLR